MKTYRNSRFTKRDYECTNIVAIVADRLPQGYDPAIWREADDSVLKGLMQLDLLSDKDGLSFRRYGYL